MADINEATEALQEALKNNTSGVVLAELERLQVENVQLRNMLARMEGEDHA